MVIWKCLNIYLNLRRIWMTEIRALLENYWIIKDTDKELYFKVKRSLNQIRKFITEQLGWKLIVDEKFIKVEKVPSHAHPFMGIDTFIEITDYCILCSLLMFLEDKEDSEQFLLSELVDMIKIQLKDYIQIDWTKFSHRKSLIRVLQYAENKGILIIYEGSSNDISNNIDTEILYENTGLSRYFATIFNKNISQFETYRDFESEQFIDDSRYFRTNHVFRQLISSPILYWKDSDNPDYIYINQQYQYLNEVFYQNTGTNLHIHKNAAFLVVDEDDYFGTVHPRDNMLSELVVLVCTKIRSKVLEGIILKDSYDLLKISINDFKDIVSRCKKDYNTVWSKEYREMKPEDLVSAVKSYMEKWMMIEQIEDNIIVYPSVGKFTGKYPKNFNSGVMDSNEL